MCAVKWCGLVSSKAGFNTAEVRVGARAMDPGHPFLRAHPRLSGIIARCLTRKFRTALECVLLFNALMLLLLLVVMHVNFVAQVGSCSVLLSSLNPNSLICCLGSVPLFGAGDLSWGSSVCR